MNLPDKENPGTVQDFLYKIIRDGYFLNLSPFFALYLQESLLSLHHFHSVCFRFSICFIYSFTSIVIKPVCLRVCFHRLYRWCWCFGRCSRCLRWRRCWSFGRHRRGAFILPILTRILSFFQLGGLHNLCIAIRFHLISSCCCFYLRI